MRVLSGQRAVVRAQWGLIPGVLICSFQMTAQQAPFTPAPVILQVYRELIKPGTEAQVMEIERRSIAEQARLKSPHPYLTLTSVSGAMTAVWYLHGNDSYADIESEWAKVTATPGLLDAWAKPPAAKVNFVVEQTAVFARLRDDLSYGRGLTGTKTRFFVVTTVSVRPGHGGDFSELRRILRGGHEHARASDNLMVYEVESGMPDGTFLIFSAAANWDEAGALSQFHGRGLENALGDQARAKARELSSASILKSQTVLLSVNPEISFPAKEWIASDSEFWATNAVAKGN